MNIKSHVIPIKQLVQGMQIILEKCLWIRAALIVFISLIQISWSNMSPGEAALANFTRKFIQLVSKDYGLSPFGSGVSFPVKIEYIILSFQSPYCGEIKEARKLAIDIAHRMINEMNQDENLLKYLSSTPATVKNVNLTIGFKDPNNGKTQGALDSVTVLGPRKKVFFSTYNKSGVMLETLHEETFEEAERIVQQGTNSNSLTQNL